MRTTVELKKYQLRAVDKLKNGSILCGGVGSGKSLTALYYAFNKLGARDIVIITTAKKRDDGDWIKEQNKLEQYDILLKVDSWNNIEKYVDTKADLFIFDEQRAIGSGAWSKAFIKIAKANQWILLSATPGDNWLDYIPVFIANGFYKNRTEFLKRHVVFDPYLTFPKVRRYVDEDRLRKIRDYILVDMPFDRPTERHHKYVECKYDKSKYDKANKDRWNFEKENPIENASELCSILRRICSMNPDRLVKISDEIDKHDKVIIFYNYDYELDALRVMTMLGKTKAEWNGHKHEDIPKTDKWVYFVQYSAGSEGWNCVETDTIMFFSDSYSYKQMEQACGRIDRMNTEFKDLYYIHFLSKSPIDQAVQKCLRNKKDFNERRFCING